MRRIILPLTAVTLLAGSGAQAQISRSPGDDTARQMAASAQRFEESREKAVGRALEAMESGDPIEAALALQNAIERVGRHDAIVGALDRVKGPAAEATEARVDRLLREGRTRDAVSLLAKVSAAVHSERLDDLLDRATLDLRLLEAAEFEGAGERVQAMRAVAHAIQLAPNDERVRAASARHGLRTEPTSTQGERVAGQTRPVPASNPRPERVRTNAAAPTDPSVDGRLTSIETDLRRVLDSLANTSVSPTATTPMLRIDQLERDLRRQMSDIERVSRLVNDMDSRQRLGGRAEFATSELDRRVRELERVVSGFQRQISSLQNDIRSLQRSVGRP